MTYLFSYIYLVALGLGSVGYYGVNAANILALTPVVSHSHTIHVNALTRALAARGHKLVVLSPDPERQKNENITIIYLEGGYEIEHLSTALEELPESEDVTTFTRLVFEFTIDSCERLLFSEGNKRFLKEYKNHKFDIIIADTGTTECFLKYAHVFDKTPIVGFSAFFTIHPSLIAHENTKLFITHNGYLSTQESIHYGVPMLGVPIVADQFKNNAKIRRMGLGLRLNLKEIKNSKEILDKLKTILDDPSYKQRAEKESLLFRDRPMGPLDTAIYWIEYVIRHNGADALKVASLDLYWFQYYLLDIYATIGGIIFAFYYVLKKLFGAIFGTNKKLKKS